MFEEEKETLLSLSLFSIIYPKKKRRSKLGPLFNKEI
jgi:hypothetical protein